MINLEEVEILKKIDKIDLCLSCIFLGALECEGKKKMLEKEIEPVIENEKVIDCALYSYETEVVSGNIKMIGYNPTLSIMQVRFHSSKLYKYYDVAQNIVDDFINAPSKGRYFRGYILNKYKCEEVK